MPYTKSSFIEYLDESIIIIISWSESVSHFRLKDPVIEMISERTPGYISSSL